VKPDLGLLAEYAEGLLDGTPAGDEVARRLGSDPAWARAYRALAVALPAVRADLAALADPGPLPAEVARRVEARLASSPSRRRWRWAAGAAAAVAVVAGVGTGATWPSATVDPGTSGRATPPSRVGGTVVTYSGADAATAGVLGLEASPRVAADGGVPPALSRLVAPTALVACLDAVERATSTGPPPSVDFGRYEGRPALVVVLAGGPGRTVVAGPACGLHGADLRARLDSPR
jgi:hypothetical protein